MALYMPAADYFKQHYTADLEQFGSHVMCGWTLADSMRPPQSALFKSLIEFVVCQFELNLLNQAIYSHSQSSYSAWCAFSVPFADIRGCDHGHGMGSHVPDNILRFAQHPYPEIDITPMKITWDVIGDYTRFFLIDYISLFCNSDAGAELSQELFLKAITRDVDCIASVRVPDEWETRHVLDLLEQ